MDSDTLEANSNGTERVHSLEASRLPVALLGPAGVLALGSAGDSALGQAFGLGPVMHLCVMAPPSKVATVHSPSTPSGRNSTYPKA